MHRAYRAYRIHRVCRVLGVYRVYRVFRGLGFRGLEGSGFWLRSLLLSLGGSGRRLDLLFNNRAESRSNFQKHTKYVRPESLKFSHWLSKSQRKSS